MIEFAITAVFYVGMVVASVIYERKNNAYRDLSVYVFAIATIAIVPEFISGRDHVLLRCVSGCVASSLCILYLLWLFNTYKRENEKLKEEMQKMKERQGEKHGN